MHMNNKNNNLIFAFGVLAVFVFGITMSPIRANAYAIVGSGFYAYESDGRTNPIVNPPAPTPTVSTKPVTQKPVATVVTKGATPITNTNTVNTGQVSGSSTSNLSANALSSGSSFSFMPDTLLEWLFLFILILLAVKLYRNATITKEEKNAPLKHA